MTIQTPKRISVALFAALLSFGASAADVSIYGKVNTALYWQDWSGANPSFSMINEGSRFGFNIREELTNDLSVKGYLENGFNSDDGGLTNTSGGNTGSTLFDRRAILALHSKTWGEIGFGRMGSVRSTMAPYALTLAWLDPMETNYGEAGMSYMFGNDPRANNTVTYVSPDMAGFKFGLSYSFSFTDQEADQTRKNNRMLAFGASYVRGTFGIHAGATQLWYGRDNETPAANLADKGKLYDREDAQAYTLGATWRATPELKLFVATQYQADWRSVAGWNADKDSTHETAYSTDDKRHGIDGWSNLVGLQYSFTENTRLLAKYVYFTGEHEMADGDDVKGKRHAFNTGLEQKLSKRTKLYAVLSYFKGEDELDIDSLTGFTGQFGMEHNF